MRARLAQESEDAARRTLAAMLGFRLRDRHGALATDRWGTSAAVGLAYFLEDRTSLSLSIAEDQERSLYAPYAPRVFVRNGRVALGIDYRFFG
jgi:hypothetical protein